MILLRSWILALAMLVLTPPFALIALCTFPFPPLTRYRIITQWTNIVLWAVEHICGIKYQVLGAENIPAQPAVILSKHQSAWETMALQQIFPPQSFVLKRELLLVPFFGWGLAMISPIAIDRSAGKAALKQLLKQGKERLIQGFYIVIFPEGTRIAVGKKGKYQIGGAWLANHTHAPVVPVAHNAGEFWRRNAFLKYPGTITVSIGPPIDPTGLTPGEINERVENWIEGEMRRLFPHHYMEPLK